MLFGEKDCISNNTRERICQVYLWSNLLPAPGPASHCTALCQETSHPLGNLTQWKFYTVKSSMLAFFSWQRSICVLRVSHDWLISGCILCSHSVSSWWHLYYFCCNTPHFPCRHPPGLWYCPQGTKENLLNLLEITMPFFCAVRTKSTPFLHPRRLRLLTSIQERTS